MTALVTMEDVRVQFATRKSLFRSELVRAVDGVSLELAAGQTLSLVGESGSGKTTLGRAALRLVPLASGRLSFDGQEIGRTAERRLLWFRRRAQAVFQDPYSSIDPFMSVAQILEEPLAVHGLGERLRRTHEALEDVRLTPVEEYVDKYPHMLSGGQRQRVGIARALILRPDFIMADEPVSMIDASSRVEILELLRELQDRFGIAFFYITHDIATARYFSDAMAVMYLGKVVERGDPHQLVDEPLHPYTQALIAAVPEADPANRLQERRVVPGEPPSPVAVPPGCGFHPRCPRFIPGVCDVVQPSLAEARPGHWVACHLYSPAPEGSPGLRAGGPTSAASPPAPEGS